MGGGEEMVITSGTTHAHARAHVQALARARAHIVMEGEKRDKVVGERVGVGHRTGVVRVTGEIKRRKVELGCEGWTSFASGSSSTAVQRTLSL